MHVISSRVCPHRPKMYIYFYEEKTNTAVWCIYSSIPTYLCIYFIKDNSFYWIWNNTYISFISIKGHSLHIGPPRPGEGTHSMLGDMDVPPFWPPFLTFWAFNSIFLGTISHPPTQKLSFGVSKLPILTEFDLFGPQIPFFLRSFWVQFSVASGTPQAVFGPSTPPGPHGPRPELKYPTHTTSHGTLPITQQHCRQLTVDEKCRSGVVRLCYYTMEIGPF